MKKKNIIILLIAAILILIIAVILLTKNINLSKNKITILDATYSCEAIPEGFYEDDTYIYSFPCPKSTSVFVKLSDGNKMLVKTALEEEKVTISELESAGLEFTKRHK